MSEADIERKVCSYAKAMGWKNRKFNSEPHDPDRMFWRRSETPFGFTYAEVLFIEFKDLRLTPRDGQLRRHAELRHDGFPVFVIDNVDEGRKVFDDRYNLFLDELVNK